MTVPRRATTLVTSLGGLAVVVALAAVLTGVAPAAAQDGLLVLDPADFDPDSHVIDHEHLPFSPGTRLVLRGSAFQDGERIRRRVETTVTDLTKEIGGVRAAVILEKDYNDGELVEVELAFRAQDRQGNVWHLGEYTETWEGEDLVGGQAWMVGNPEGAQAGILMPARPRRSAPDFSQGYAPAPYNWADRGRVVLVGGKTAVPAGDFDDVVIVEEWDAADPSAFQLKYYAPGVGNVRVGWRGEDEERETLQLLKLERLDADALAAVRDEALALEARAYVYGMTAPATPLGYSDDP
ncbi:MAG TPA: hypothetical protein VJZ50_11540 [Candidatus Limnocylindrales bacterium]|nr:hypothetical protein [Candidatus Limnocylindrales bacterium]